MGMDVHGINPTGPKGEYFRNNVWWWRPLWEYCEQVAPSITSKVKYGYSNDGDGLNAEDSRKLAVLLNIEVTSGNALVYEKAYDEKLINTPEVPCFLCNGVGMRELPPSAGGGKAKCGNCDGKGTTKSFDTYYNFSEQNVAKFSAFLYDCGGFEIW